MHSKDLKYGLKPQTKPYQNFQEFSSSLTQINCTTINFKTFANNNKFK